MKAARYILLVIFLISFLFLCKSLFLGYYPDFSDYYFGPKELLLGHNPYLARQGFFTPFVYPPLVLFFFSPLVIFPFHVAEVLWTAISLVLLFSSLLLLFKIYHQKLFSTSSLVLGILVCLYFPVKFSLGMGQINIAILFLITLGMYFYNTNKKTLSGLLLGLPILLKFFPLLVIIYFAIKKQWKTLALLTATVFVCVIGAFIVLNHSITTYFYFHIFPGYFSGWKGDYYNQSFSGVLMRAGIPTQVGEIIRNAFSLIGIVITFVALFLARKNKSIHVTNLSVGAIMSISLLANNFSWQHHFVWLLFPLIATFYAIEKLENKSKYYILLGISYILTAVNFKNPQALPLLLQSHVFYGAFLLWVVNLYILTTKRITA